MSEANEAAFIEAIGVVAQNMEKLGMSTARFGVLMIGFGFKLLKLTGMTPEQIRETVAKEWTKVN